MTDKVIDALLAFDPEPLDRLRRLVRVEGGFSNAVLLTDGYDFWVESWKNQGHGYTSPMIISLRCKTPREAWQSCCEYLAAR
jgi:hypothetical protein